MKSESDQLNFSEINLEDIPTRINKLEAECEMLKKKIPNVDENQRKKIRSQMIEIQNQLNRLRQQYLMENYEEDRSSYQIGLSSEPYSFQIPSKLDSPRNSLYLLREEKDSASDQQYLRQNYEKDRASYQIASQSEPYSFQIPSKLDSPRNSLYLLRQEKESQEEEKQKIQNKLQLQIKFVSENKSNMQRLIQDSHLFYNKKAKTQNINGRQTLKNYVNLYSEIKQKGSEQKTDKFNLQKVDVESVWDIIQKAAEKRPEICHLICEEVMNQPISQQSIKESEEMKKKFAERAKAQPESFANTICVLIQLLEKAGVPVILSQKSTVQSKISLRALTGEFMENAIKVQEKIEDDDPDCPYKFDDLYDSKKFEDFCAYYKKRVSKETGLNPEKIYISSVAKGSIRVQYFTDDTETFSSSLEASPVLRQKLKLHKFFAFLHLSPQDFDPRGNIKFFSSKDEIQTRGGWPYYQPISCKRYGINVLKKYDNGDDTWLMMNGKAGQWAVAYHGVRAPKSFVLDEEGVETKISTIQSIMGGMKNKKKTLLQSGKNQVYKYDIAVNKSIQNVGHGIYCSPHIQQTFQYAEPTAVDNQNTAAQDQKNEKQKYRLIFQCRVNPNQVKVCDGNQVYWVINDTKNIRPYGIILMKSDIRRTYPEVSEQFRKPFKYEDFKQSIESYISSYK